VADIETLENFYVRAVAPPVVAWIVTFGISLFAGQYHPLLGWVLAGGLFTGGVFVPLLTRLAAAKPGVAVVEQRAALRSSAVDGIQGMPDLISNNQGDRHIQKMTALSKQLVNLQQQVVWAGGLSSGLMVLVSGVTLWFTLWAAIPMVESGLFDGVSLAVLALIALASFEAVTPLGQAAQQLESSLEAARRLFTLVETEPEVLPPAQPCSNTSACDLHIRGLSFRYRPELPDVLDALHLDLPAGKRLALVGPSGAGKTTLANLLLRFWDYSRGEITLGGCDLRQISPENARRCFGVIAQKTYLFTGTLRDNLLLACPSASNEVIETALVKAGLLEWVAELPSGLDTWAGERGIQISGGERQRLAIARCLLQDAPILLLDEPTANLDALTEARLLDSLSDVMQGRSVLWITHRLAGLEMVDEIAVMQNGRIVQRGTHTELVHQEGLYRRLWTLQNRIILDLPGTSAPSPAF